MALVKKSKLASSLKKATAAAPQKPGIPTRTPVKSAPLSPRHRATATERIAAATEELASGLTESAAATRELGRSMSQISAGAEEAAGASQEQSVAIRKIVAALTNARQEAESSNRRTEAVAISLSETSTRLGTTIRAIERAAHRQAESVTLLSELDRRAKDIGHITRAVSRISDQTNLLALNAAIEAARAGENGRGFAVVADEVRTLAESSDRNAREVQRLADSIQTDVVTVGEALRVSAETALGEARSAASVSKSLESRREEMATVADGTRTILSAAVEAERAAEEAQKGAEQIASAADEQSSGAAESQTAVDQQAKALEQGQIAAQNLAGLAEQLRAGKGGSSVVGQIGANSEELSASIQELSTAAAQVMAAIEQINRASQLQSAATQETSAALNQIESSARIAQNESRIANARVGDLKAALIQGRASIESLIAGVAAGLGSARSSVATLKRLEGVGRKIEKIVDAIALVAVQTSMLAVSGAVEAARTGESGKGFAVVSNDIRVLSREASENVERAKDTVRGILDQIALMRNDLDQTLSSAEIEVENTQSVLSALLKIEKEVDSLAVASRSIEDGAEGILHASTEIAAAARQIATAAEEASAASRESATASSEMARGVEDLAAAIEEIATLADELRSA